MMLSPTMRNLSGWWVLWLNLMGGDPLLVVGANRHNKDEPSVDHPHEEWVCCTTNHKEAHATTTTTITDDCVCQDRMHTFPGWTSRQPLPSPWYSGLLTYEFQDRLIHTHYVLVLAEPDHSSSDEATRNEDDKPLIYWSNGGPGASSMFGLLTELGPLVFNDLSTETDDYRTTGIPTPFYNPHSWSKLGHLLIFDVPAPVGFSYCEATNSSTPSSLDDSSTTLQDTPLVDCAGLAWTDELAAANTMAALQAFYEKYPALQSTDLYLTGESYAGIYIPTFAREILRFNHKQPEGSSTLIPLKGFAVGDGCLGTETGICGNIEDEDAFDFWYVLFLAGHNQIPLNTFQEVMRACQPFHQNQEALEDTDVCRAAVAKVKKQMGGVYAYGLYDECTYRNGLAQTASQLLSGQQPSTNKDERMLQGGLNDYQCGGDVRV